MSFCCFFEGKHVRMPKNVNVKMLLLVEARVFMARLFSRSAGECADVQYVFENVFGTHVPYRNTFRRLIYKIRENG
jgi:hypothetical protein